MNWIKKPSAAINSNPTLAWNTTSTVGKVGNVALTVKMPANPDTNTTYSFSNSNPTLAWNTTSTIGTVGGVALTVKMPANPDTNTTYAFSNKAVTLAWNKTHTIATVGGTNITLKMPANPNTNTTYSFVNSNPTLAWGTKSTVGTVGGVALTVTMPSNPNTWRGVVNNLTSTVTDQSLSAAQGKILNDKIGDKLFVKLYNDVTLSNGGVYRCTDLVGRTIWSVQIGYKNGNYWRGYSAYNDAEYIYVSDPNGNACPTQLPVRLRVIYS